MYICLKTGLTERGILITFKASIFWLMAYKMRNITLEARLFWYMAYKTRDITFEARFLWIIARLSKKSFVGFHKPLRGQKRLAPLAKRSTCSKSRL